jgi:hypothetical protein
MITAALLALALAAAPADEVELNSGTVVEGKVQDLGDSIRVVRSNGSAVYPKSMIRKITPKKTVEELYEEKAAALKPADLDGHLQLARWCVRQKLAKESLLEFNKVIALAPDHEEAREAAGFQKIDGRWLPEEEANAAKGLVKHKGKWTTPELRDLDLAMEEKKELDKALQHEVAVQISHLKSGVEKTRQDAVAALERIDDKYKVKAYLQAITSPQRELRKFVFQELGRIKDAAALKPLVRRSLWDDDADLRPVAYRAVLDIGHPDAALFYLPFLAEESISARIRCVEAMAGFKDLRVVPALLQSLENNIELTRSFDKEGEQMAQLAQRSIVLGDGSSVMLPRSVRMARNFDVLDKNSRAKLQQEKATLLSTLGLITGQSFGEDFARWRAWLDKKKAGNG